MQACVRTVELESTRTCCAGDGDMPPGGNFMLPDWCIEVDARPGAGVMFDSSRVYHHSVDADSADPKYANRMACGLYVSQLVRSCIQ